MANVPWSGLVWSGRVSAAGELGRRVREGRGRHVSRDGFGGIAKVTDHSGGETWHMNERGGGWW